MKYASIVPLIGGETIGMQNAFGTKPEYILSYEAFKDNDDHLVKYYNDVPYYLIDNDKPKLNKVDVINTVCPCAGLSSLNVNASSNSETNDWMKQTSKYVLEELSPTVFWGENAPRLASKMGEPIVDDLKKIGKKNGYVFSLYKTKSRLHGLGQTRERSFYFFWKGDKMPRLEYIKREHEKIEDTIRSVKRDPKDPMNVLVNQSVPTENPYYKYVLQEIEGGISHSQFQDKLEKSVNLLTYIENNNIKYNVVKDWMSKNNYEKEVRQCERFYQKLKSGMNIMRRTVEIPKDYIGAFVGHMPTSLAHPDEDRFLTIRECLSIMGLPEDFQLQGGLKNLNHICQNVPVTTATDMAEQVKKFVDGRYGNQLVETNYMCVDNKSQSVNYEKNSVQLDSFMI